MDIPRRRPKLETNRAFEAVRLIDDVTKDCEYLPSVYGKFERSLNFNTDALKEAVKNPQSNRSTIKEAMFFQSYSRVLGHHKGAFEVLRFIRENSLLDEVYAGPIVAGHFNSFNFNGVDNRVLKHRTALYLVLGIKAGRDEFVVIDTNHKLYSQGCSFNYLSDAAHMLCHDSGKLRMTDRSTIKELTMASYFCKREDSLIAVKLIDGEVSFTACKEGFDVAVSLQPSLVEGQLVYDKAMSLIYEKLMDVFGDPDAMVEDFTRAAIRSVHERASKSFLAQSLAIESAKKQNNVVVQMDFSMLEARTFASMLANEDLQQFLS